MKSISLIFIFCFFLAKEAFAQENIYGKWKLKKIEPENEVFKTEIIIPSIYKFKRNGSFYFRPAKLSQKMPRRDPGRIRYSAEKIRGGYTIDKQNQKIILSMEQRKRELFFIREGYTLKIFPREYEFREFKSGKKTRFEKYRKLLF